MEIRWVGVGAALVEVDDANAAIALAAHARRARLAEEVVPGACTVLLDGLRPGLDAVDRLLAELEGPGAGSAAPGPLVTVGVTYDGADLADVARAWGTDEAGVVARHTGLELVSVFCGFAPGFAYLAGLPPELAVPRLEVPRTRVPAGSVGLADGWCGIYPTASPGGWRLIGRTDAPLWDPDREPAALLAPGTRVRFEESP